MSGGPVWYIGMRRTSDGYEVEDRRLVGIAYYQTADRRIICHGETSIYRRLLPILAEW